METTCSSTGYGENWPCLSSSTSRVPVGAEGREGLQLAIGRQVETQRAGDLPHGFDLGGAADPGDRDADVDGRPDAGIEQVTLEEALAIGDRDDVGRDVGRYLSLIHI